MSEQDKQIVRAAVVGAAGRMGRRLIALAAEDDTIEVVSALESADCPHLGADTGELAGMGKSGIKVSADLAGALRSEGISCDLDYGGRGIKGQFKQADRSGASHTLVLGEDELAGGYGTLRDMSSGEEKKISVDGGPAELLRAVAR